MTLHHRAECVTDSVFEFPLSGRGPRTVELWKLKCRCLILGVGGENGQLGDETALTHFECGLHSKGDFFATQLGFVLVLFYAHCRKE
jgi:hypothetical protein